MKSLESSEKPSSLNLINSYVYNRREYADYVADALRDREVGLRKLYELHKDKFQSFQIIIPRLNDPVLNAFYDKEIQQQVKSELVLLEKILEEPGNGRDFSGQFKALNPLINLQSISMAISSYLDDPRIKSQHDLLL